jgi:hypothetical protein
VAVIVSLGKVELLRLINFPEGNPMTTKSTIALTELAEKGADVDLLCEMIATLPSE